MQRPFASRLLSRLARADRALDRALGRRFRNGTRRADDGFVLLETLVAMGMITVVMGAFTTFFVDTVQSTNHERARQAAAQIADSSVETIRSLPVSDLVTGRTTSGVASEFGTALANSAAVLPWLSSMVPAVDPIQPPTATAKIPMVALNQTVNNIVYSVTDYLGSCVIVSGATDCGLGAAATGTSYLRAVVAVTWGDSTCPAATCSFLTATLLNQDPDLVFNPAQTPPPLPQPVNPGAQTSTLGNPDSLQLAVVTGTGAPAFSWSVTAGALPAGLTLNPVTGLISGSTTTLAGPVSVTVTVADSFSTSAIPRIGSTTFTWQVVAAPTITTPANQATPINTTATLTVAYTCPNTSCTFSLTNAPVGLSINAGLITGAPSVAGTVTMTVSVTDHDNATVTSAPFTWAVSAPAPVCSAALVLPNGSFEAPAAAPGPRQNYTGGSSPLGWNTTASDGQVELWANGGADQVQNGNLAITAEDGTQWAELNANAVGALYQDVPTVPGRVLQWSAWHRARGVGGGSTSGQDVMQVQIGSPTSQVPQVPTGQTTAMISDGPSSWVNYTGVYTVPAGQTTTRIQFAAISTATGNLSYGNFIDNVTLTAGPCLSVAAPAQTSPVNTPISTVALAAAQGSGSYVWSGGSTLPRGLSLSSGGAITGTPTATGTSAVSLTLTDTNTALVQTVSFTWTVTPPLVISPPGNQTSARNAAITALVVSATGGTGTPYTWTDPGSTLPTGLSISTVSNQGRITGTPTVPGTYPVQLTVTDSGSANRSTVSFTWTVSPYPALIAASPGSQSGTVNTVIATVSLSASGGSGSYSWTGGGTLPAGLALSGAGRITGTPTSTGTTSVTLTVTDTAGTTQNVTFTWVVYAKPTVTTPSAQATVVGGSVNLAVTSACPNTPCTYTLRGAPAGLTISSSGISGTVAGQAQTYTGVTVTVTDNSGVATTSAGFTWTVTANLVGRWTFDNTIFFTAPDSNTSGTSHSATLTFGAGTTATAAVGTRALTVNGTSGAAVTSAKVLDTTTSFTVSAWVKLNTLTNGNRNQTVVSQDGNNISAFFLGLDAATGKFRFQRPANDVTGGPAVTTYSNNVAVVGQWYQIAGVYDDAADTQALYVDGVLQQTTPATTDWNATGSLAIGRGLSGGSVDWVNGSIDDVRAYSAALSAGAIAQIAEAGYWNLDEGSGTTAKDGSLNNFNATLAGGTTWTAGVVGPSAVQFNGATGVINTNAQVIDTSQSYSVSAWAKPDVVDGTTDTVASMDGTNASGFELGLRASHWALTTVASDRTGSPTATIATSGANVVAGQWYQVTGVYDSVADTLTLYVNGAKVASVSYTVAWPAGGQFVIGRGLVSGAQNDFFTGAIDDVTAYQFPLDQTAATALANAPPPTPAAPTATAGSGAATVSWVAPATIAGSPVTGYVVTPYLSGVAQTATTYNSTATTQTLTGLNSGGSYTFTVAAVNGNGTSPASAQSGPVVPG